MFLQFGINWDKLVSDLINYSIEGAVAILIILIAWVVGSVVGRAVNRLVERTGLEKAFDKTDVGKAFRAAGVDLSNLIGMLVTAFIVVIGVVIAIGYLKIGGEAGALLAQVAQYLPRLIGGIILLTVGIILVALLTDYIGKLMTGLFPQQFVEIGEMLRNLLLIGLIALIVSVALDLMLFTGPLVYPLILGTVIIGAGIFIGHTIVRNIVEDHGEFASVAPYAKFLLYLIFLMVGLGAIFANFPNTAHVVQNVAWGVAIAAGIMLAPIIYTLAKKMVKEEIKD
ncbi:MAG: mechanosensitive ion channel family protein [Pyrobaculum sp.]|uniref:mechanosensitive ion channel family protein n=1 Tax=Pyrobaculum sp. TaxID=2004705 RepID=UPI003C8E9304